MNPALLQNPYSIDYPLNTENKYLNQERTLSNSVSIQNSEYPFISQRNQHGLSSNALGQTLSVPANPSLDYNLHPSTAEQSFIPGSQYLLSPPSSIYGTHTSNNLTTSGSFNLSSTQTSLPSNASSTDQFPSSIIPLPDSPWSDTTMTDLRQTRPPMLHPQMRHYSSYPAPATRAAPFTSPHSILRSINASDIPSSHFINKHTRSPTFAALPMPVSFAMSSPFAAVPPQYSRQPEGPPFEDTKILQTLVTNLNHSLSPELSACIQKGFFQVDGKWTCYRRNYFTVQCAFTFKPGIPSGQVYLRRNGQLELVQQYAVSISAKTGNGSNQESETRQLVQHTPKRDKATESIPSRHIVQPAPFRAPATELIPPYVGSQPISSNMGYDGYATQSHLSAPTSYTFERIQFQRATANNGKRRAAQQYFHIVVELSVNVGHISGEENWVTVATKQSHPMVVRGRSPGHYKDNVRRDSQTNMDPDRNSGHGSDGSNHLPMPPFMGSSNHSTSMDWTSSHRGGQYYGRGSSKLEYDSACSPQSTSSSAPLTSSPTDTASHLADLRLSKTGTPYEYNQYMATRMSDYGRSSTINQHRGFYRSEGARRDGDSPCEHAECSGSCSGDILLPPVFGYAGSTGVMPLRTSTRSRVQSLSA